MGKAGNNGKSTSVSYEHRNAWAGNGTNGGSSSFNNQVTARGGAGGEGGGSSCEGGDCYSTFARSHAVYEANGTSYSGGATAGNNGFVLIAYGEGIE